ncbi:trans-aconitate 2-methyltransferase [Pseudomonas sp. RIT-PI-AD]|uniref:trans-aconitate 2-methyltransferase n=1 Tax=Pseudomonas sp. RIT-PI-AD TaxID=3035294 RepID=UPI0021D9B4C0|nr:trans-aconitate 2-methyltransferase [Pseudomonas sp. RIT-PI-AD]
MTWSARQYSLFEQQRTRPVRDLVAAIPTATAHLAVDLGCGPGNSTEVLAERFPDARVTGIDSSEDMLAEARRRLPALTFELADIAAWNPAAAVDVILANASLQWLPDHASLYPRLVGKLKAGGTLAVQTPDNLEEPAHRLARQVAAQGPWADRIGAIRHPERHTGDFYFQLLSPCCRAVDVWRTTYLHPLANHAAVVEWFKGSALRPYLDPLEPAQRDAFLAAYLEGIVAAYPALDDGRVLLPFPRLFVVATR